MYCKNCGEKIDETCRFCPFCGIRLSPTSEKVAAAKEEEDPSCAFSAYGTAENEARAEEPAPKASGIVVFFSLLIAIFLIFAIVIAIREANTPSTSPSLGNGSAGSASSTAPSTAPSTPTTRLAKKDDVIISYSYEKRNGIYYYSCKIQAQEKVTDLSLEFSFWDSSPWTSSTKLIGKETLYVGKVVPGNVYTFDFKMSDLSKTDRVNVEGFSYTVLTGEVEK